MSEGARALFVDTGAFYARFDEDDQFQEQAVEWYVDNSDEEETSVSSSHTAVVRGLLGE